MRKFAILFIFSLPFLAMNCEGDLETGTVELKITGSFGDDPLMMFAQDYIYEDGTPLRFQLVNFYLSDISLVKADDPSEEGQLLSDIELVSFKDIRSLEDAEQGLRFSYNDVPAGSYSGLRIGVGIAPDLNATQPGDYEPGHPLDDNYWSWARGYVFAKIEGNADLDGDGEFGDKLTYHIGDNELYTIVTFDQAFTLQDLGQQEIGLNLDLREVLVNNGQYLDLNQEELTQDHTIDENIYGFLWDNLVGALGIK